MAERIYLSFIKCLWMIIIRVFVFVLFCFVLFFVCFLLFCLFFVCLFVCLFVFSKADEWATMYWLLFGVNPLLSNTRFCGLYFRMKNCKAYLMLNHETELSHDPGRLLCCYNFTDRQAKWLLLRCFFFSQIVLHLPYFQGKRFYKWLQILK